MKAEAEASSLYDWNSIYKSYLRFKNCDDGAIAEGYSESISRMLGEKWIEIQELQMLIHRDKNFRKFVIRHIDETIPAERLLTIRRNALERCPRTTGNFCKSIIIVIDKISEEEGE